MINKKGQLTIFIIVAIVIVAGIVAIVVLRDRIDTGGFSKDSVLVYNYFLSCVEDETKLAASLMGSQAGYLEVPEFEPGSEYMPFSSHLDFFGFSVPYWYYVAGNGIAKENIPSKGQMQKELGEYLEERIMECDFEEFEARGFIIETEEPKVEVEIEEREIKVKVEMPLEISFAEETGRWIQHEVVVKSRLGKFYDIARKVYENEKASLFLENYGVDVLRLYAPVDGVELSCSPKFWLQGEIKEELRNALEANVQAIKVKGDYYSLDPEDEGYFVQDLGEKIGGEGEYVNFLYSRDWPTRIEIYADDPMLAKPIGLQEGLGMLGFCYVPYHFVYDMAYPVLVQVYDDEEMFQFPIGVVIDKNLPREGFDVEAVQEAVPELCKYPVQEVEVYTYNIDLDPVEVELGFECLGASCDIGKTEIKGGEAVFVGNFPQCLNGFITAEAEGYAKKRHLISTNMENSADLILNRLYDLQVQLKVDGRESSDYSIISFVSQDNSQTIAWPAQKQVSLSEGSYDISVYVYKDSKISIPGTSKEQCVEAPKPGILGILGSTEEKCFQIDLPAQELSNVISGGGKSQEYIIEPDLKKGRVEISVDEFPLPQSLDDLQDTYNLLDVKTVDLNFG